MLGEAAHKPDLSKGEGDAPDEGKGGGKDDGTE
jgi:hypothetical protein